MLNGSVLNDTGLNDSSGPFIGEGELLIISQNVVISADAGEIIELHSLVGDIESGDLLSLEQDVIVSITGSGDIISIEQNVATSHSDALFYIEQRVIDISTVDHLSRTGWDATLIIDGNEIDQDKIHGTIRVTRSENQAALMEVTLIPSLGVQP